MIGPSDHLGVCATPIVKCETARTHFFSACDDRRFAGGDQKSDFFGRRLVGNECGRATFVGHKACTSQPIDSLTVRHRLKGQLKVECGFACKPSGDHLGRVGAALEWQGPVQVTSVNLGSGLYIVHGAYPLDGTWKEDQT